MIAVSYDLLSILNQSSSQLKSKKNHVSSGYPLQRFFGRFHEPLG
jgi:hypothetical protein